MLRTSKTEHAAAYVAVHAGTAKRLKEFLTRALASFPWAFEVRDWNGGRYAVGQGRPHWRGIPLTITIKTPDAGKDLLALRGLRTLERFVAGEIDMEGNLYLLQWLRHFAGFELGPLETIWHVLKNRAFQNTSRAAVNVRNHYDIPQEVLNEYLDRVYMSYSCGMWEDVDADRFDVSELVRRGNGAGDDFDSLEKAQWRKFRDAVDFADPRDGDSVLDIGCGYGGQLIVGNEAYPMAKFVGWTHSENQIREGRRMLGDRCGGCEVEFRKGDYREETRSFDHILSTGMISHVGPGGLEPYVRWVRAHIHAGGRYLHHSLMRPRSWKPLEWYVGAAFNKKYVWPGFHWFDLETHRRVLERNGFRIVRERDLTLHYGKTTASWYERMMAKAKHMRQLLGEQEFRAWQIYLSGASAGFRAGIIQVHRLYCEAV